MFKYTICFFTILIRLCFSLKYLPETSIKEELSIGSFVTTLTDKIPNLDQSDAYDLVSTSNDLDLFSIDHSQRTIIVKNRIDFEHLCRQTHLCNCKHCLINTNIAVSNSLTIDVYTLPIHVINIDDNKLYFNVNRTVIEIEENTSPISRQYFPLPMAIDDDFDSQIDYELYTINWQSTTLFRLTNTTTSIVNEKNIQFGIVNSSSSLLYLEPLKSFDREQQYIYLMRLVAKSGIHQISTDIIVLITDTNDNIPQCEQSYYKISINSMNDDNITQITAYDLDQGENARIAYNIVNQHIYPNNMFTIDHINGNMKFTYKNWTSYLDYFKNENSTKNLFQLKINVTDFGKPKQLSSECIIELEFTSILNIIIHLHEHLITNQTGMMNIKLIFCFF
ncbi:unnamed protein product [Didymodactylos carnosus]|uniref:Cadherin domain-containing protein n=1 Tax=Didymodactylos carnosus TaxID=1234261 RepID=A0A8S2IDZ7_9BILA|nr:unnamed protein product [Didymodactylos carnosus]CAF3732045.1 unnamed protein product [Didymodactylos carnosus]